METPVPSAPPTAPAPAGRLAGLRAKASLPLAAVLVALWLALLGSPAAALPAAAVALLWWSRPLALAGLFMAAIALALWLAPARGPEPAAPTFQPYVRAAAVAAGGTLRT